MASPLYDALFAPHAESDAVFLRFGDRPSWTYRDFIGGVQGYAQSLVEMGLCPGDRVAVQVAKSPEAIALYGACVAAGLVLLPLNTGYTASEVSYFVSDAQASMLICDPAGEDELQAVASAAGAELLCLDADGGGSFATRAATCDGTFPAISRAEDDLAAILYTSGTTGRSKGAMLSHKNLLSNAKVLQEAWRFTANDVLLHALPVFHTHGLFVAINTTLLAGGSLYFLPRFELEAVLAAMPACTAMMGVPTFYTRLLNDSRFDRELAAHMRLFTSGSAPLLAETHRLFEARTGHRILERYGMTETNMNTSNPYEGERRAGTVGFALPGTELRVTDAESGDEVAAGETGRIEVRGDNVFRGYWQMPDKTATAFREDGFFVTGDIGFVDGDGYVHLVGRESDLIIAGGYNIYPKEIEEALDALPGIVESAVVGVPHRDLGEAVLALVVCAADTDLDACAQALGKSLARFKQPRKIERIDALPRNAMGKVEKKRLRQKYSDVFL